MYDPACMEMSGLESLDAASSKEWASSPTTTSRTKPPSPSKAYSKRSAHMADLRARAEWAVKNADGVIQPPSAEALLGAKIFINNLSDACLDFKLAISQAGEINFFFGTTEELFQILIDESGLLSHYANTATGELAGNDIAPENFQYLRLLQFVERKK
jgi:hypothetical protein